MSLQDVLNHEKWIERAFARVAEEIDPDLNIYAGAAEMESDDLPTPRMEIEAALQEMGPHQAIIPTGKKLAGLPIYDHFSCLVQIRVVLARDFNQSRERARATIRQLVMRFDLLRFWLADEGGGNGFYHLADSSYRQTAGTRTVSDQEGNTITIEATLNPVFNYNFAEWPVEQEEP